jgi:hypothetical protein
MKTIKQSKPTPSSVKTPTAKTVRLYLEPEVVRKLDEMVQVTTLSRDILINAFLRRELQKPLTQEQKDQKLEDALLL